MYATILALAVSFTAADAAPIVTEDVDTIAVCHVADGAELVFFFSEIQGEWACLDHRWRAADMTHGRDGDRWMLAWHDDGDSCYRVIRAAHWIESYEPESPLAINHNKPWFARLCAPGLKSPTK